MKAINNCKQLLADRLALKGLEKDTISSFIRSMRICFAADPKMDYLKTNRLIQFLGWNNIDVDALTLQLAITCFEAESVTTGFST